MYQQHFGLRDQPFTITPDPSYLYLSPQHQEALAHLLYGIREDGGFVQLTGEVGTGKTTLIRSLLAQQRDDIELALCVNPRLTEQEFVASICDELGVAGITPGECDTLKPLIDALNRHLLDAHANGKQTVLIIDEAQNLSLAVLEQVRLLTNLETHRHKLLRIILVGQPELAALLERPQLRQLAQRITARYHLPPLGRSEVRAYVEHRLNVAGGSSQLFTRLALNAAYRRSGGIPRLLNIICDRALLGAYVRGQTRVNRALLHRAAHEVLGDPAITNKQHNQHQYQRRTTLTPIVSGSIAALAIMLWPQALQQPGTEFVPQPPALTIKPDVNAAADVYANTDANTDIDAVATITTPTSKPTPTVAPSPALAAASLARLMSLSDKDLDKDKLAEPEQADKPYPLSPLIITEQTAPAITEQTLPLSEQAPTPSPPPVAVPTPTHVTLSVVDLHQRLAQTAPEDALQALAQLWQQPLAARPELSSDGLSCDAAGTLALRCLFDAADWDTLRAYNRPAVLELTDANGATRHALLRSLTDDLAVLLIGGDALPVPRARLEPLWTGRFLLFWQAPFAQSLIGPGSRGEPVAWLRRQLALATQQTPPSPANAASPFDADLRERVKQFQRRRRLQVDGLVGSRTMLLLNNINPQPGIPLLDDLTLNPV